MQGICAEGILRALGQFPLFGGDEFGGDRRIQNIFDDGHDFAANNRLLLRNLEGVANRRARFRTVISLLLDGEEHLFEGIVEGRIIDRETGHEGFGFDPLFIPDGYDRTFAQMTTGEKNEVSHRARAVRKLAAYLHSVEK